MQEHMLSTIDNPYNPFTQFDEWFAFDTRSGYNTCGLLARIAVTSDDLSDGDQSLAYEQAVNEIMEFNVTGMFIRVTPDYVPRVRLAAV